MPKQVIKMDMFHGGLNSHSDPRDILVNELADSTDVAVHELGKIRNLGGLAEKHDQPDAGSETSGIQPGYGLFQFSHDLDGADDGSMSAGPMNYLALTDTRQSASVLDILKEGGSFSNGASSGSGVTFSNAVSAKANMYYVDGALRTNDVDFGSNSSPTWYGYVGNRLKGSGSATNNKTMMSNATTKVSLTELFYDLPSKIEKPAKVTFDNDEAIALSTASYTQSNLGTITSETSATYTVTDDNITAGSGPDTINSVTVVISVDSDAEGSSYRGNWKYDLTVRQSGGGNSVTITDVEGNGATNNTHVFSYASGVSVGSTDWQVVLNVDTLNDDISGISVQSAVFQKDAASWQDHTATLANNEHGFHIALDQPSAAVTGAYGWAEDWEIGMSLIYDENQESLIKTGHHEDTTSITSFNYPSTSNGTEKPPGVAVFCQYSANWNKRITGAIVYMKRLKDKQWYPQYELDFVQGVGKNLFSNIERTVSFATIGGESFYVFQFEPADALEPQLAITYESRTGISHEEKSIASMWKTSCVANRRAYIGNVKVYNEDGTTILQGDKMMRSLPNKFDIFPLSESVDVAINDGEDIVALVEFNDRILQFKERTLYIINASQDMEFLEDKLPYRGISHQSSVFKTEYGVIWANNNGCYFYDGRQVNDLLQKEGRTLISQSVWESFLGTYPLVGYSPKKRQIIVVDDISNNDSANGSCYIYDMVTRSWTKGASGTFSATAKTNFAIDWDGDLILAYSANTDDAAGAVQLVKWDDAADTTANMSIRTKDIDFGTPSQKKSVKKVYITYKGDARNVQVQYAVNGDNDTYANFFLISSDGSSTNGTGQAKSLSFSGADGSTPGVDDWVCAELKPAAGSVTCNSFAIKISGDGSNAIAADFEINDISIVYRPKSIK